MPSIIYLMKMATVITESRFKTSHFIRNEYKQCVFNLKFAATFCLQPLWENKKLHRCCNKIEIFWQVWALIGKFMKGGVLFPKKTVNFQGPEPSFINDPLMKKKSESELKLKRESVKLLYFYSVNCDENPSWYFIASWSCFKGIRRVEKKSKWRAGLQSFVR